ncbi:unnamed protein product [Protopolystoma xenopodis]|uniref:Uncharacterized protein n=1 Tax=Protopolystoma xenopodis TaxID=117903 RepID=A0A3S5CDN2_9PLAT|nr:unnamed protein product [Protopolystoma xenopodis]
MARSNHSFAGDLLHSVVQASQHYQDSLATKPAAASLSPLSTTHSMAAKQDTHEERDVEPVMIVNDEDDRLSSTQPFSMFASLLPPIEQGGLAAYVRMEVKAHLALVG